MRDNNGMERHRVRMYRIDSSGSGQGPVEGSCEHGNISSGSI